MARIRRIRCKFCKETHDTPRIGGFYELHCPNCGTLTKVRSRSAAGSGADTGRDVGQRKSRSRSSRGSSSRLPGLLLATMVALLAALLVTIMEKPPLFFTVFAIQFALYVVVALFISCLAAIMVGLVMAVLKRHHHVAPLRAYPLLVIILSLLVLLTAYLNMQQGRSLLAVVPLPEHHESKLGAFLAEAHGLAYRSLDNASSGNWQTVDETPTTQGDLGKVERLIKQWNNKLVAIKNEHLGNMEAIRYDTLLDADRLAADTDFSQSMVMMSQARESLARQDQQILALANSALHDIEQLNISAERKAAARAAYQDGMGTGLQVLSMLAKAESETIDEQEKIIRLLDARRGFWEVSGGRLAFMSADDTRAYRAHTRRIEQLGQMQDSNIRKTVEDTLKKMERYRR